MVRRVLGVIVLVSCIGWPAVAAAQERAPHTGSTAVGIDVGAFLPAENEFDNALIVSALLEYYVTPRVSLRTDFGLTDPGFARDPRYFPAPGSRCGWTSTTTGRGASGIPSSVPVSERIF